MSKSPAPRLKLVIRRLPPTLPEDVFWRVAAPYVDGKSVWRRFVAGRPGDNFGAHPVHSRAYVLMKDVDALVAFHTGFDGHVFRAKTGAEYQAVVEYAPIEKTPFKTKSKTDQRQGTIEDDPDYKSFLESLSVTEPKPVLETSTPAPQPTSTPLLDALRAQQSKSSKKKNKDKKDDKKDDKDGSKDKDSKKKAAALASISEAANKRAPKGDKGNSNIVMVAGKGRDVYVGSVDEIAAVKDTSNGSVANGADSKDGNSTKDANKKKKARPPKKKKDNDKEQQKEDKTAAKEAAKEEKEERKEKEKEEKKEQKEKDKREKKAREKKAKEANKEANKEAKEKDKEQQRESKEPKSPRDPKAPASKDKDAIDEASHDSKRSRARGRKGRGGGGGGGAKDGGTAGDNSANANSNAGGKASGSGGGSGRQTLLAREKRPVAANEARIDM